jgi:hypothetical protein
MTKEQNELIVPVESATIAKELPYDELNGVQKVQWQIKNGDATIFCCCACNCDNSYTRPYTCCGVFPIRCGVISIGIFIIILTLFLVLEQCY